MPIELKPLPPPDAVAYLESKGLQVTRAWTDLWQEEHARAFTVAGLTQLDVLQDIQDALREALVQGLDVRGFQKALVPKLQAKGWWGEAPEGGKPLSPERLRLIYDVNTRTAYMAGMWGRIQRQKARWPFFQYSTMRDKRVRPQHRVWEGITLPVDDPWWETHFPPNGFRCRCTVTQRGAAEAEGQPTPADLPPEDQGTTPWVNPRTGETVEVPKGVDPGWAYNPGQAGWERLMATAREKLGGYDPALAQAGVEQLVGGPSFERWLQRPEGNFPVLYLAEPLQEAIGAEQRLAVLSPETLAKQAREHPELGLAAYRRLPALGSDPDLAIQDGPNTLVLVKRDGRWWHAAIKAAQGGERETFVTSFRATTEADVRRLLRKGTLLWVSEGWRGQGLP